MTIDRRTLIIPATVMADPDAEIAMVFRPIVGIVAQRVFRGVRQILGLPPIQNFCFHDQGPAATVESRT